MSLLRRNKAMSILVIFITAVFICYGYYTLSDMNVQLMTKDHLVIRSTRHEKVLKEQLKVVYLHSTKLEEAFKKEKASHRTTKQELLMKIKQFQLDINKTKYEASTRFNALDTDYKMLKASSEEASQNHIALQQQYVRLSDDHKRVATESKEDYEKLKSAKESESISLQDRIQELFNMKVYYQNHAKQQQEYSEKTLKQYQSTTALLRDYQDRIKVYEAQAFTLKTALQECQNKSDIEPFHHKAVKPSYIKFVSEEIAENKKVNSSDIPVADRYHNIIVKTRENEFVVKHVNDISIEISSITTTSTTTIGEKQDAVKNEHFRRDLNRNNQGNTTIAPNKNLIERIKELDNNANIFLKNQIQLSKNKKLKKKKKSSNSFKAKKFKGKRVDDESKATIEDSKQKQRNENQPIVRQQHRFKNTLDENVNDKHINQIIQIEANGNQPNQIENNHVVPLKKSQDLKIKADQEKVQMITPKRDKDDSLMDIVAIKPIKKSEKQVKKNQLRTPTLYESQNEDINKQETIVPSNHQSHDKEGVDFKSTIKPVFSKEQESKQSDIIDARINIEVKQLKSPRKNREVKPRNQMPIPGAARQTSLFVDNEEEKLEMEDATPVLAEADMIEENGNRKGENDDGGIEDENYDKGKMKMNSDKSIESDKAGPVKVSRKEEKIDQGLDNKEVKFDENENGDQNLGHNGVQQHDDGEPLHDHKEQSNTQQHEEDEND